MPRAIKVEVVDPVLERADGARDNLPHGAFARSYRVAARIGVEQILHEVAG